MRPAIIVCLAVSALAMFAADSLRPSAAQAQSGSVKAVFEKYDLFGTLAADCKSEDSRSLYIMNRAIDAEHVQLDRMVGRTSRQFAAIIDKASETKPNEIALSYTIDNQRYNLVVRVERGRMRTIESTRATGDRQISGGRSIDGGAETPWFAKCGMSITIQSSPKAGGKCIDVPASQFKAGMRLQMWDCNETPAQTFTFDALNNRLMIGDLCVGANGGRGQPNDQVQLDRCDSGPSQSWKTEANGDYVKFVGMNGLCIDIVDNSKNNRAPLKLWRCHGEANQSWVLRRGLDLAYEERMNREGHHLTEFNLAGADPKLCQASCIDNHQCSAWVYRKPEGRADKKPHCWLLDKTTKVDRGDAATVSGTVRPEAAN